MYWVDGRGAKQESGGGVSDVKQVICSLTACGRAWVCVQRFAISCQVKRQASRCVCFCQ